MMFGFGFNWIIMIIFWGLIIFVFISFVNWIINQNKHKEQNYISALDILKNRYARGEINQKEFIEKRKDLEK